MEPTPRDTSPAPPGIVLPARFLDLIYMISTYIVLGGFVVLYAWAIIQTWTAEKPPVIPQAETVYVATTLAGLIGAVVSMAVGQNIAKLPIPPGVKEVLPPGLEVAEEARGAAWGPLRPVTGQAARWKTSAVMISVSCYIAVGLSCMVTLLRFGSYLTNSMISNFAFIFLGFFINLVRAGLTAQAE
jgi:hypothetical protein